MARTFCLFAMMFCVAFALCAETVFAELPSTESPKRNRVMTYEPVRVSRPSAVDASLDGAVSAAMGQGQNLPQQETQSPIPQRSREMFYKPAGVRDAADAHTAARPIAETLATDNRNARRAVDALLAQPLDEPMGVITDPDTRKQLDVIRQMTEKVKSGQTTPGDATNSTSPGGTTSTAGDKITPGNTVGLIVADNIFQLPGNTEWFATKDGEILRLIKYLDKFYKVDDAGSAPREVIVSESSQNKSQTNDLVNAETPAVASSDDKLRNAALLIVTTIAVLAALSVGFLAFDYKHRWEQEVVTQNNRLLGNGASGGSFSDSDSFEPETLSFSSNDYGSLDNSFGSASDHSFRTIA